jgi:hypothetical protein
VLSSFTYEPSHTFAGRTFEKVLSRNLGEGMYFLTANVELASDYTTDEDVLVQFACELRDGATVLSGARAALGANNVDSDNTSGEPAFRFRQTLPLSGGRAVPASGAEISIWCSNSGSPLGSMDGAQLMVLKVAGSF